MAKHPSFKKIKGTELETPIRLRESIRMAVSLKRYVIPLLPAALGVLLLALISADLILGAASMARYLTDSFMPSGGAAAGGGPEIISTGLVRQFQKPGIIWPVFGTILFVVLSQGLGLYVEWIRFRISQKFRSSLQRDLLSAFLRDSGPSRLDRDSALAQVTFSQDAGGLGMFLIFGLLGFVERLVKLAAYTIGLCRIGEGGWMLALILIPAAFFFKAIVMRAFLPLEQKASHACAGAMIASQRTGLCFFSIMARLVLLGGEKQPAERLLWAADDAALSSQRLQFVSSLHGGVGQLLTTLALPLSAIMMSRMAVSPGLVIQGSAIFQAILDAIAGLLSFPGQFVQFAPALQRVSRALKTPDPGPRPPDLDSLLGALSPPSVKVDNLTFAYDPKIPLLSEISFVIPAGSLVCITGRSGSGKTTLARLLAGDRTPQTGVITVESVAISDWPLWWRREVLAFLPAETGLMSDSLEENIRFGRDGISDAAVTESLRVCGLEDAANTFSGQILHAPEQQLSTGQQRRVGVARLLLGQQPVWIIDEPLANLDPSLMRETAQALHRAAAEHTVIVITHDPEFFDSTFNLFLKGGILAAQGTHQQLLNSNPDYHSQYGPKETCPLTQPPCITSDSPSPAQL